MIGAKERARLAALMARALDAAATEEERRTCAVMVLERARAAGVLVVALPGDELAVRLERAEARATAAGAGARQWRARAEELERERDVLGGQVATLVELVELEHAQADAARRDAREARASLRAATSGGVKVASARASSSEEARQASAAASLASLLRGLDGRTMDDDYGGAGSPLSDYELRELEREAERVREQEAQAAAFSPWGTRRRG